VPVRAPANRLPAAVDLVHDRRGQVAGVAGLSEPRRAERQVLGRPFDGAGAPRLVLALAPGTEPS
jgi:hypothetical protein